ncbi:MAG: DUF128 domain-containing protein [Planctomycetes bacterium]|nr:DUF128 domain-containing protein [Planctomycetota bacterium]
MDRKNRNRMAILSVLEQSAGPLASGKIAELLAVAGYDISERSVRMYLKQMDREGVTENHPRRGRTVTERGRQELRAQQTIERVGYLSARIDQMTYRMTFDLQRRSGTVVVNTSLVDPAVLYKHLDEVCQVFAKGYAMGNRVCLFSPGERIGATVVPPGRVGFCTVCSITLNGVLLKHGVPTSSRFGGLLELNAGKPRRFVEIVHYDGTTIDPLEVFIRSGMTGHHGAIDTGSGRIGASFREHPADARELVLYLAEQLREIGLGAFLEIGLSGQSVLGVPVPPDRIGSVVIGGLNPIAILEESNHRLESRALAGLVEYNRLFHFEQLPRRLRRMA